MPPMPDTTAALAGAMGLCRKAGALVWGADRTADCIGAGKAKLVLLTADASPRTRARFEALCHGAVPLRTLPLAGEALAAVTARPAAVFAVTDQNLARLCARHLAPAAKPDLKEEPAYGF